MNIKYLGSILILLLATIVTASFYIEVPYIINTKGIIYPQKEWKVRSSSDGIIKSELKDYSNNTISQYSVLEFQRGDFAEFRLNNDIFKKKKINKGDTIGIINSNEEIRRLVELKGDLESKEQLLNVYLAGAKAEELEVANKKLTLAQQEYSTQKIITDRNRTLHEKKYISDEVFELSLNQYKKKLHEYEIAKAEYKALASGAKPEQIAYLRSNISAIEAQISQLHERVKAFSVLAPFSGILLRQHNYNNEEVILKIADVDNYIAVFPVELSLLQYIKIGQPVQLVSETKNKEYNASVISFDNRVQMINFRQNIFVTAKLEKTDNQTNTLIPNMVVNANIDCGKITVFEYVKRFFRNTTQN